MHWQPSPVPLHVVQYVDGGPTFAGGHASFDDAVTSTAWMLEPGDLGPIDPATRSPADLQRFFGSLQTMTAFYGLQSFQLGPLCVLRVCVAGMCVRARRAGGGGDCRCVRRDCTPITWLHVLWLGTCGAWCCVGANRYRNCLRWNISVLYDFTSRGELRCVLCRVAWCCVGALPRAGGRVMPLSR